MEYKKWEVNGTIVWSNCGDDSGTSAVICAMAEPYPSFVEYHPLELTSKGWHEQMDNATLIIEAVNACISINPQNPLAVAKEIGEMYKTLISCKFLLSHTPEKGILSIVDDILSRIQPKE